MGFFLFLLLVWCFEVLVVVSVSWVFFSLLGFLVCFGFCCCSSCFPLPSMET